MVHGWKTTIIQVKGSPEQRQLARQMLTCAREWLRGAGRCQARLPATGLAKCGICPLFDPEWATESYVRHELTIGPDGPRWETPGLGLPDYLPEEWGEG
jgi:hypothetical protein